MPRRIGRELAGDGVVLQFSVTAFDPYLAATEDSRIAFDRLAERAGAGLRLGHSFSDARSPKTLVRSGLAAYGSKTKVGDLNVHQIARDPDAVGPS